MAIGDNVKAMTLEARIALKIREDFLGSLMSEEDLEQIVRQELQAALKARGKVENPKKGYNEPAWIDDPLTSLQRQVLELMKPAMQSAVEDWCDTPEATELLRATIELMIQECVGPLMLGWLNGNLQTQLNVIINERLRSFGLPA